MASTFKLGSGTDVLDLGIDGSVSQGGSAIGNWRTTPENKLQVKRLDGTSAVFDVGWKFNADNQLVLLDGATEVFNFQSDNNVTPGFELQSAVLKVTPSRVSGFSFELRGEWDLTATHDLELTIGGRKSRLKGFISDPEGRSRFLFVFVAKNRPALIHRLQFEGTWSASTTQEGGLVFNYKRPDGTTDSFELPGKITIHRTTNQLRYEYKKNGTKAIDFEGALIINENFQIVYSISRQQAQSGEMVVGESILHFGAVFSTGNVSGSLELTLKKPDGTPGETILTINGSFTGVLGSTNLAVGFTFQQIRAGQTLTTTFGFAGTLKIKNNATVTWQFTTTNTTTRTIDLMVGTQIELGSASVDARLNLTTTSGQVKGVTFLLGIRF